MQGKDFSSPKQTGKIKPTNVSTFYYQSSVTCVCLSLYCHYCLFNRSFQGIFCTTSLFQNRYKQGGCAGYYVAEQSNQFSNCTSISTSGIDFEIAEMEIQQKTLIFFFSKFKVYCKACSVNVFCDYCKCKTTQKVRLLKGLKKQYCVN